MHPGVGEACRPACGSPRVDKRVHGCSASSPTPTPNPTPCRASYTVERRRHTAPMHPGVGGTIYRMHGCSASSPFSGHVQASLQHPHLPTPARNCMATLLGHMAESET